MKLMLIYLVIGAIFAYFFGGVREGEYGYRAFLMIFWPLCVLVLLMGMLMAMVQALFTRDKET